MRTLILSTIIGLAFLACGGGGLIVPGETDPTTCPDTVFASTGSGLCGVLHTESGIAYPCVSTCEATSGAQITPGCWTTARMHGPFDHGTDGPDAVAGTVVCGCDEFCK